MPYSLIPLLASILLGLFHVLLGHASLASKAAVASAVVASLVIGHFYPAREVAATLLQVATSIYVVLHYKVNGHAAG